MNDNSIFPEVDPVLKKKYSKEILMGRILIFSFAVICVIAAIGSFEGNRSASYGLGSVGVLFLTLGFVSIKWPFVPLVIAAAINSLLVISSLIPIIAGAAPPTYGLVVVLFYVLIVYFLVRAAISSKKYNRLAR